MRVLIISDTHGSNANVEAAINKAGKIDFLIHAGDSCGGEEEIRDLAGCPVVIVHGNNGFDFSLKNEEEFELGSHHVLVTHGHRDGVYYGTDRLIYKAMERGADIVVYGHTHVPSIEYDEEMNIYAINPGSLSYPRQIGHKPSFAIMEIDEKDEIKVWIDFL